MTDVLVTDRNLKYRKHLSSTDTEHTVTPCVGCETLQMAGDIDLVSHLHTFTPLQSHTLPPLPPPSLQTWPNLTRSKGLCLNLL